MPGLDKGEQTRNVEGATVDSTILPIESLGAVNSNIVNRTLLLASALTTSILSYGSVDFDSLNNVASNYLYSNPDSAFIVADQMYEMSEKRGDKWEMGIALNIQGYSFYFKGDYAKALERFNGSLILKEEINDREGIAVAHVGIGSVCYTQGDFEKTLEHYNKAIKIYTELGDQESIAMVYVNIGAVNYETDDYYSALVYYKKALKAYKELGDKSGILRCKTNIGIVYYKYKDYGKALLNYNSAVKICEEIGSTRNLPNLYVAIGEIQRVTGEKSKAVSTFLKGLEIATSSGFLYGEQQAYSSLSELYAEDSDHKQALAYYKLYTSVKDSLFNEDKSKEIGKIEASHEFEMGQMEHKREQEQIQKQQASAKARSDNLQYSAILIFLVVIFTAVFMLGKFSIPMRLAEGMIFFAFLLFFEFMLVMLDPYIEDYSGGAPAIKLGFNAILAGMIFPLHSLFEAKMKSRLL